MKYFQRKVSRCDGLYGIATCRAVPVNRVSNRHRVKPPDDLPRFALEQTRLQDPPSRQESKKACLVQSEGKRTRRRSPILTNRLRNGGVPSLSSLFCQRWFAE